MAETFGERLRRLRHAQKMTLRQVAKELGVTPQYVSLIELGTGDPRLSTLRHLAKALGTTVRLLLPPGE